MRTAIPLNNFAQGQIDRDLKGRYDLPLTQNGHEIDRNFQHSQKGCIIFRPGMKFIDELSYSALYPFYFNSEQSYIMAFTTDVIRFFSYYENDDGTWDFVIVTDDDGNTLEVEHPWGDDIFDLHLAQNCDVVYINHIYAEYPEYQLTRTAANEFTLAKTTFTNSGTASLSSSSSSSNHGYPGVSVFYENRMNRCGSTNYPTYLYGSEGGDYDVITVGTDDNDGYQFDLSEANSRPYWAISGSNSLLIGTPEGVMTVNGGSVNDAITPTDISAKLSCTDRCSYVKPVRKDNAVFYVSRNQRKMFYFSYDVLYEQFKAVDITKANYEITKGKITKLVTKEDKYGLMYAVCGGKLLTICFSSDENVNSWSEWTTDGEIIDICSITRPDGDDDLLLEIKRTINGEEKYYLEMLTDIVEFSRKEDFMTINGEDEEEEQQDYQRYINEELRACNYLDCSVEYSGLQQNTITYDESTGIITAETEVFSESDVGRRISIKTQTGKEYGLFDITDYIDECNVYVTAYAYSTATADEWYISATTFSGLDHLEGETVSVTGNGGYIGEFTVENGTVDISSANTNKVFTAVIGLKYTGMLKSPNLGLSLAQQGTQTFTTKKNIYEAEFMFSFSGGGLVGDSLYHMEDIQDYDNTQGLFDNPAPLMDTVSKKIYIAGTPNEEKHYYVVQDQPMPLQIDMIVPHYKHTTIT